VCARFLIQIFLSSNIFLDVLRQKERKTFTQDAQKVHYDVYYFYASEPPLIVFGRVGDIAVNGELVWFRSDKKWEVASKEVDSIGRPCQQHPVFKSKRRLDGLEWKAQTIWNSKKRKHDELNGTRPFPER
jgi:hypothetical protein